MNLSQQVLFIRPSWAYPITKKESTYNRIWPPLDLANCAALLQKDGHEVVILDAHAQNLVPAAVARQAKNYDLVFVTSSPLDRWQCPNLDIGPFLKTAQAVKKRNHNLYVMGYHGTATPKSILFRTGAKAVIRGEPEEIVREICSGRKLSGIKGITYLKKGQAISNKDNEPVDLTALPRPAFELLPPDRYFYEVLGNRFMLFEFSRGCPFQCTFCSKDVMYRKGVRKKSFKQITAELDYAIDELGIKNAYFFDLEFNVLGADLIKGICNYLIQKQSGLQWCCQLRADKISADSLRLMRQAGCKLIHCGIETGTAKTMQQINKAFSLADLAEGVRRIEKADIRTLGFFMLGFPWETKADVRETIQFAKQLDLTYASFHLANPYPQTKLAEYGKRKQVNRIFIRESASQRLTTRQLHDAVKKALIHFYLQPKRVAKLLFRSNRFLFQYQARLFFKYLVR